MGRMSAKGDPRLPDRRIAALRALDGPGAFVGGRGQPHGRRDGLDDDCQARAVEPPLGRRPRGARRTGENLRRPATVSARRHHVPQQEHPGVDLRGAAHHTPGGLSVTTNVAAITTPYHNGKGIYDGVEIPEMGTGMTTWTSMRPQQLLLRRSPDQKKQRQAQNAEHGVGNTTASPSRAWEPVRGSARNSGVRGCRTPPTSPTRRYSAMPTPS